MTKDINFIFPDFIKPALQDKSKYVCIAGGRRIGKTWNLAMFCIYKALMNPNYKILWVDTKQGNISKYVDRYFKTMIANSSIYEYNQQKQVIKFANGSYIDFGSAEVKENLEGFEYDLGILNEAGIILDGVNGANLWNMTLKPMFKNAKVYICGTPKGENTFYDLFNLASFNDDYSSYKFTAYDSPYWNHEDIEKEKATLSTHIFKQEYLGEFTKGANEGLIKSEYIKYYSNLPEIESIVIHCDLTHTAKSTSDYFCLCVMGRGKQDKKYYVMDWLLDKIDPQQQSLKLIEYYKKYKDRNYNIAKVTYDAVSNDAWGEWTRDLARKDYNLSLPLEPLKIPTNKYDHFSSHVSKFIAGEVLLNLEHGQIKIAVNQLESFPDKNTNDDFCDGVFCCLSNLSNISANTMYLSDEAAEFWGLGKTKSIFDQFIDPEPPKMTLEQQGFRLM